MISVSQKSNTENFRKIFGKQCYALSYAMWNLFAVGSLQFSNDPQQRLIFAKLQASRLELYKSRTQRTGYSQFSHSNFT